MRLLHVTRNPGEHAALRAALGTSGHRVEFDVAATPREATVRLEAGPAPDIVLLASPLVDPDAIAFIMLVRQQSQRTQVVVTANPAEETGLVAALDAGADDYLVKGRATAEELQAALAEAAARRAAAVTPPGRVLRVIYVGAIETARRQLLKSAPEIQLVAPPPGPDVLPAVSDVGSDDVSLPHDALVVEDGPTGVDTLELLKEVRRRGLQLPVVVVTGPGRENIGAHALRLGAAAHLVKTGKYFLALRHTLAQVVHHARLARRVAGLARSEAQLHAILDSQPVGLLTVARDGTLLFANTALVSMLGVAGSSEILGRSLYALIAPDDRENVRAWVKSVAEGQRAASSFTLAAGDGALQAVHVEAVPFRPDPDQGVVVLAVIRLAGPADGSRDEAREVGISLDVANEAPIPTFVLAGDRFCFVNRAMMELTGYTEAELLGVGLAEILHPDDREMLGSHDAPMPSRDTGCLSRAVRVLTRQQGQRWVVVEMAGIAADPQPAAFGMAFDVTEAVEARRALADVEARAERSAAETAAARAEIDRLNAEARALAERAEAATAARAAAPPATPVAGPDPAAARRLQRLERVAELAEAVSEDWTRLLDAVEEDARRLRQALPPSGDGKGPAERIMLAAAEHRSLARQLLAFSRKHLRRTQLLDVTQALNGMSEVLHGIAGESIDVDVSLDQQLPPVAADGDAFRRAVAALALLGQDLLPCGGSIALRATGVGPDGPDAAAMPPGLQIDLTVSGRGMNRELQDRLLHPGAEPAAPATASLEPVRRFVAEHLGDVAIEGEPGRRTTFTLRLPAVRD